MHAQLDPSTLPYTNFLVPYYQREQEANEVGLWVDFCSSLSTLRFYHSHHWLIHYSSSFSKCVSKLYHVLGTILSAEETLVSEASYKPYLMALTFQGTDWDMHLQNSESDVYLRKCTVAKGGSSGETGCFQFITLHVCRSEMQKITLWPKFCFRKSLTREGWKLYLSHLPCTPHRFSKPCSGVHFHWADLAMLGLKLQSWTYLKMRH